MIWLCIALSASTGLFFLACLKRGAPHCLTQWPCTSLLIVLWWPFLLVLLPTFLLDWWLLKRRMRKARQLVDFCDSQQRPRNGIHK